MSKKNPEKFQQKQIKDKEMKRKKEIRKRQEKLHTFISIMYYSDQVYLHYYALTFGATLCSKSEDILTYISISLVMEFLLLYVLKRQDFDQKLT